MSGKVLIYRRGGDISLFMASSLAQNGDGLHFTGRDEHKLKAVTQMSKSLTEATSIVDPRSGVEVNRSLKAEITFRRGGAT
jgi:hypothetical protein